MNRSLGPRASKRANNVRSAAFEGRAWGRQAVCPPAIEARPIPRRSGSGPASRAHRSAAAVPAPSLAACGGEIQETARKYCQTTPTFYLIQFPSPDKPLDDTALAKLSADIDRLQNVVIPALESKRAEVDALLR
jgi:hypothetical protein